MVPAVLGGLAITVMALVSIAASRRSRAKKPELTENYATILVHSINKDRCTGCDACVAVCPTNVLDLIENKSEVVNFHDCIQCEACMWACPTEALVMFKEGTTPPALKVPELDQFYQTAVPGQYLIGEVAGKPLIKNAANLGRAVIEHAIASGLRPGRSAQGMVDVAIVGSGPGGLSAALSCLQQGLSYVLLEKEQLIASTISRYPKGKLVMAEPYDCQNLSLLPVFDSSKEELVPMWGHLLQMLGITVNQGEAVEHIEKQQDGTFNVKTTVAAYRASRVVIATGTRGKPRTLGVPGENLPKIRSLLEDPGEFRGQSVLVVGGGDSALEAVLALADAGAKVILSYRGRQFSRAQPKLRSQVEDYEKQRRIKIKFQSQITEFDADTVTLQMTDGSLKKYPNTATFVLIGSVPPVKWLETLGIRFVARPHQYSLPQSDALVRQFVPNASICPESAEAAASLITGRPMANPVMAVSKPRRWLRSATSMFAKRVEEPVPLGEFARRNRQDRTERRHSGRGRRDMLPASERTRVLRMLRDEGGRIADEESAIEFVPSAGEVQWGGDSSGGDGRHMISPGRPGDIAPRQAVIVGLAEAAARGPRGAGPRRKRRTSGPPPAQAAQPRSMGGPPPASARRTDTNELLDNLIKEDRKRKSERMGKLSPEAPTSRADSFGEAPTRVVDVDAMAAANRARAHAKPDEPTAMANVSQFQQPPVVSGNFDQGPTVVADSLNLSNLAGDNSGVFSSGEDPTRAVDISRLAERSQNDRVNDVHDAKTRQIDLKGRPESLSDVEWDLD